MKPVLEEIEFSPTELFLGAKVAPPPEINEVHKKMLYLAYRDLSKKWTMPIRNWAIVLSNFSIIFKDRIEPYL